MDTTNLVTEASNVQDLMEAEMQKVLDNVPLASSFDGSEWRVWNKKMIGYVRITVGRDTVVFQLFVTHEYPTDVIIAFTDILPEATPTYSLIKSMLETLKGGNA